MGNHISGISENRTNLEELSTLGPSLNQLYNDTTQDMER